jgi:ketosteroid isomerase-like protein
MKRISILILLCFTLIQVKAQSAATQREKEEQTIRNYRNAFNAAIERHDTESMQQFMRDDYNLTRGNATQALGKAAVMEAWQKLFTDNPKVNYVRTPSIITLSNNDSLAWESGSWKAVNSYSKGGNYAAMWRKTDKVWKLQSELFVSLR